MFVFNPMTQGLELLAQRELQKAENMFLLIINDPYTPRDELKKARHILKDIRTCQNGYDTLDFEAYRKQAKDFKVSFESIRLLLSDIYFYSINTYQEIDEALEEKIPEIVNRLKQVKIPDIGARDNFFDQLERDVLSHIKSRINKTVGEQSQASFDDLRWKSIFRKFVEQVNPILLERHLELLQYILSTGEMQWLEDPKLTVMTPKYRWILESTLNNRWYLLRSYFFKARSEIEEQFNKKEGTRKYWEEVKYKKIKIFEDCGFTEANIQKFLFTDKLNYKTLEEIYHFAAEFGLKLIPRDVSLALRGVDKAKDHIKERGGLLLGERKNFQDRLIDLGFSQKSSYQIAKQAKKSNNYQIAEAFSGSLQVAREEIYWYRIPAHLELLKRRIEAQCQKHLSTVRIHLFDRGRLNKLLLLTGKPLIKNFLLRVYGEEVLSLHCYFRLETIHQYYKLKYYQHHAGHFPSVSELIKISRKDFQPLMHEGYDSFVKKRRLKVPDDLYRALAAHRSVTNWEDAYTIPEEKLLLKFWFLMDHGVAVTQRVVDSGVLYPGADLWGFLKNQSTECNS